MTSSLRHSFYFSKSVFNYNKHLSQRCFSAVSTINDNYRNNNHINKLYHCELVQLQSIQNRKFSFDYSQNFFTSLASSDSCKLVKQTLIEIHDFSGLPWYVTLIGASVALKLCISFPCALYQKYLESKLEITKLELKGSVEDLKKKVLTKAQRERWTQTKLNLEYQLECREQWQKLIVKNNCHPLKIIILSYVQLPFWLLLTLAIRGFAVGDFSNKSGYLMYALQFQAEGLFWCPNLAEPDPFFILPAISLVSMLASTEISNILNSHKIDAQGLSKKKLFLTKKIIPNAIRFLSVCFFCVSSLSPSAVSLFWASSSAINLGQNLLFLSPKVKKLFRIPKAPSDLDKPYSFVWNAFVEKFTSFFLRR